MKGGDKMHKPYQRRHYKKPKKNILHKILKNLKIVLEISKVIKEILKLFW